MKEYPKIQSIFKRDDHGKSTWGDFIAEGLVLRPEVDLFAESGKKRIITKVKYKDFR